MPVPYGRTACHCLWAAMQSLTLRSYSKVNLDLRILGRYEDGYHKLLTLFHRISLTDTLHLRKAPAGLEILCRHPAVPCDGSNIMAKAWLLLIKRCPKLGGVRIRLIKKIPVAAGLGGGSGNAAAFLLGVKRLYGLRISQKELLSIGFSLGADVPFFLSGYSQALGKGRGEQLKKLTSYAIKWFVLIAADYGLSTRDVYRALPRKLGAASLTRLERTVRISTHFLDRAEYEKADRLLRNDLEKPAVGLQPEIAKVIKQAVDFGAPIVRMSGSGPTVFALFPSQKKAKAFARQFAGIYKNRVIFCHSA